MFWIIAFSVISFFVLASLIASCIIFFKIFYSFRKPAVEFPTPDGAIYDPYRDQMIKWIKEIREMEHRDVSITSHDKLKLCGKYYEYKKGAPIEILFHGYKGCAESDLSGSIYRCYTLGHSALIVDHRASGASEGRVITFGAKESLDCVDWVNFVINNINPDAKIVITGISMGAATVMTASSLPMPKNVVGVIADCGYTSTKEIITKVMNDMKLPGKLLYPFARLGAILFGGFDPDKQSPIKSMAKCKLPIVFFHGDADDFVPCSMSIDNYNTCIATDKTLVISPGAGHGLCFLKDMDTFFRVLTEYFSRVFYS